MAALRYIFGDINYGVAFTRSVNHNIGEIDSISFQFYTVQNIHGVLNTFYSSKGYKKDYILVSGLDGSMLVEGNRLVSKNEKGIVLDEKTEDSMGHREEFEDFYNSIRLGKKVKSSFYEGYKDLQVIMGAINSTSKWKNLELE